jgi:large-conductance mechanosensitive channel
VSRRQTGNPTTEVAINYGSFLNIVITFVIVALVVYVIASMFIREAPAAPTKTRQYCKETVPADATKCRACTSAI